MDIDTAKQSIESALPGFRVETITAEGEGDFFVAYTVNGGWIFRFPRNVEAVRTLQQEVAVLPALAAGLPLPVPDITWAGRGSSGNIDFAGYPKIRGVALTRRRFMNLSPQGRERCARDLARFLLALHTSGAPAARQAGIPECAYPFCRTEEGITPGTAADQYGRNLKQLLGYSALDAPSRKYCSELASALAERASDPRLVPALVHGDLSAEHVLFNPASETITGIIDFSDIVLTDPLLDVMYLFASYGSALLDPLLDVYSADDKERTRAVVLALYGWYTAIRLLWALDHDYTPAIEAHARQLRELAGA